MTGDNQQKPFQNDSFGIFFLIFYRAIHIQKDITIQQFDGELYPMSYPLGDGCSPGCVARVLGDQGNIIETYNMPEPGEALQRER